MSNDDCFGGLDNWSGAGGGGRVGFWGTGGTGAEALDSSGTRGERGDSNGPLLEAGGGPGGGTDIDDLLLFLHSFLIPLTVMSVARFEVFTAKSAVTSESAENRLVPIDWRCCSWRIDAGVSLRCARCSGRGEMLSACFASQYTEDCRESLPPSSAYDGYRPNGSGDKGIMGDVSRRRKGGIIAGYDASCSSSSRLRNAVSSETLSGEEAAGGGLVRPFMAKRRWAAGWPAGRPELSAPAASPTTKGTEGQIACGDTTEPVSASFLTSDSIPTPQMSLFGDGVGE